MKKLAPREIVPAAPSDPRCHRVAFLVWAVNGSCRACGPPGRLCSRLVEGTFTADEVSEVLHGLQAVVHSEVESELLNTAHTNVLLLRQLFAQAEKWYLKLQTDISELENR